MPQRRQHSNNGTIEINLRSIRFPKRWENVAETSSTAGMQMRMNPAKTTEMNFCHEESGEIDALRTRCQGRRDPRHSRRQRASWRWVAIPDSRWPSIGAIEAAARQSSRNRWGERLHLSDALGHRRANPKPPPCPASLSRHRPFLHSVTRQFHHLVSTMPKQIINWLHCLFVFISLQLCVRVCVYFHLLIICSVIIIWKIIIVSYLCRVDGSLGF